MTRGWTHTDTRDIRIPHPVHQCTDSRASLDKEGDIVTGPVLRNPVDEAVPVVESARTVAGWYRGRRGCRGWYEGRFQFRLLCRTANSEEGEKNVT